MSPMSLAPFRSRPQRGWIAGNAVRLLENGEQYYPSVFDAIAQARHEVLVETFILFEDKVGLQLQQVLIEAARRGVRVDLSVDGWGSPDLSAGYIAALADAGVQVRAFDPAPKWSSRRLHMFRRMHRKIVVVDGRVAFVGGINFSADQLLDFGAEAKQDYSMRIEGPLAARIRTFAIAQLDKQGRRGRVRLPVPERAGDADAMLVVRDNRMHRDDIERQYRAAIRSARREITIANAYFFPGYRLLKALRRAARSGVRVRLVLQGQPDMAIVTYAAATLHAYLMRAGIAIYEYTKRPLHGKVAFIDDEWATVGSSNLDPLSLALNLEANVIVRDKAFNDEMRAALEPLIANDCRRLELSKVAAQRSGWRALIDVIAYHMTRHFPAWAGWLPAHTPRLEPVEAGKVAAPPLPAAPSPAGQDVTARTDEELARTR
jgi:cardiolipin synthase